MNLKKDDCQKLGKKGEVWGGGVGGGNLILISLSTTIMRIVILCRDGTTILSFGDQNINLKFITIKKNIYIYIFILKFKIKLKHEKKKKSNLFSINKIKELFSIYQTTS